MKKILLIVLTMILALSCVTGSFAWSKFEVVTFSRCNDELPINGKNGPGTGSGELTIRNDWSVNRNAANNTDVENPDETWNYNSIVVLDEDDYDEFKVAEVCAPQCFVSKYTGYSDFENGDVIAFELKKGATTGFSGAVLNYGAKDILPVETKTTNLDEYFITMYPAKSTESQQYAIATGYGFTFLPDSDTKVRVFVRCFNGDDLDVIYYDIDLGVDLTKKYYTYCFYYTTNQTKFVVADALDNEEFYDSGSNEGYAFPEGAEIGGKVCAIINFSNSETVSKKINGTALTQKYCRTASIQNGLGEEIAKTDDALVCSLQLNDAELCFLGEGTTCRVKTLIWTNLLTCPTKTFPEPEATEAPATAVPTDEPKTTDAPATEEPKATDAPKATEEPKATDAPSSDTKKGCGGFVGTGVLGIAILGVVLLRKKEG